MAHKYCTHCSTELPLPLLGQLVIGTAIECPQCKHPHYMRARERELVLNLIGRHLGVEVIYKKEGW